MEYRLHWTDKACYNTIDLTMVYNGSTLGRVVDVNESFRRPPTSGGRLSSLRPRHLSVGRVLRVVQVVRVSRVLDRRPFRAVGLALDLEVGVESHLEVVPVPFEAVELFRRLLRTLELGSSPSVLSPIGQQASCAGFRIPRYFIQIL